jgi:hypothetical protein
MHLARAVSGLLALLMRWVELVRSLQVALRAAEKLGDPHAMGWAVHELGTLQLGAENVSAAERRLGQAREIRRQAGDREGLSVTDHNLQALCRLTRQFLRERRLVERNTRLQRLRYSPAFALAVAAALLAGGAIAGAAVQGSGGGSDANGGGVASEERGGGGGELQGSVTTDGATTDGVTPDDVTPDDGVQPERPELRGPSEAQPGEPPTDPTGGID